jgi:hypothetical protein
MKKCRATLILREFGKTKGEIMKKAKGRISSLGAASTFLKVGT